MDYRAEQAKQRQVEVAVKQLSASGLKQEACWALVTVLDGDAWWDIKDKTGLSEVECRRIRAVADAIRSSAEYRKHM